MNEKINKNAKVEKLTNMLGIAVRLIVIDPFTRKELTFLTMFGTVTPSLGQTVAYLVTTECAP